MGRKESMYKYIVKRVLLMLPTLLGAACLIFFLLRMIPGDVCELRLAGDGQYVDPDALAVSVIVAGRDHGDSRFDLNCLTVRHHFSDQAGYLDRLCSSHVQYRRDRDPVVLAWHHDYSGPFDKYAGVVWNTVDAAY